MNILCIAAFPHEVKPLIRSVRAKRLRGSPIPLYNASYGPHTLMIAQGGLGTQNGERLLDTLVRRYTPHLIISLGFCGALYADAQYGDLVWTRTAVQITKEKKTSGVLSIEYPPDLITVIEQKLTLNEGTIFTLEARMRKADIISLAEGYTYPVCDMETYAFASFCNERAIPFITLRSVTDLLYEEIPFPFFEVIDGSGSYERTRALGMLIRNPLLVVHACRLFTHSRLSARNLAGCVLYLLAHCGDHS